MNFELDDATVNAIMIAVYSLSTIIIIGLLIPLGRFIYKMYTKSKVLKAHREGDLYKVTLPKDPKFGLEAQSGVQKEDLKFAINIAEQMFSELRGIVPYDWRKYLVYRESLSFEIMANAKEIGFYFFCSDELANFVKDTIFAAYPNAEISRVHDYYDPKLFNKAALGYVECLGPEYTPIRTSDTMVNDPLNPLLNKLTNLRGDEMVVVQTYVTPVSGSWRNRGLEYLRGMRGTLSSIPRSQGEEVNNNTEQNNQPQSVDANLYRQVESKLNKKGYLAGIRIVSYAPDKDVANATLESVARSYSQFDTAPLGSFQLGKNIGGRNNFLKAFKLRMQSNHEWFGRQQFIVNTEEIATLFHFPGVGITTPKVSWQNYKTAVAPSDTPNEGLFVGYNSFRSDKKPIFMTREDRRRHFYMIGQTGTGKSEYLKNLILQDINNGEGCAFIDPHGDMVEDILTKIPAGRVDDVIYWNPGDSDFPIGLNIMEAPTAEAKNIVINSFIALLYKLYDPNHSGIMGPMLERTIRNVMLTAMEEPGSTLIEALRLLTSPEFAKTKIDKIKDPLIKTFWTEQMARTTEFHKSETLSYFVSKFDRFVSDITLRNIIGQSTSSFNFADVINTKKILLINLSKGTLGEENSAFLGTLIIPRLMIAAMQRASIAETERKDFYLYVDEFQNFATPDFVEILSEARKYRLNLTVANQYISQIRNDIKDAIFGNVGTVGAFRVGIDDAAYLAQHFKPAFNEFDLINNGIGNLYIKLLIKGKPSQPFSVALDWKETQAIASHPEMSLRIKELSREKYGRPRDQVESEIIRRAQLVG